MGGGGGVRLEGGSDWRGEMGGGREHFALHIRYVPRERPPFSTLNFHSGAYRYFHKRQINGQNKLIKIRSSWSITILVIARQILNVCRSGDT